jgi:two-component system, sensor histidine kinase LadS
MLIIILFFHLLSANDKINQYEYFVDKESTKNIEDMILMDKWNNRKSHNLGYSNYTHWFKFHIKNKLNPNINFSLVLENTRIEEIDLFFVEDGKIISSFKNGLKRATEDKNKLTRNYIYSIPSNYNNLEIYVKVKNHFYPLNLDFNIYSNNSLETFIAIDNYIIITQIILLVILFVMHILIFRISKVDFYKYYLAYLFLIIIVSLYNSDILNLYLFKYGVNDFIIAFFRFLGFLMVVYLIKLLKFFLDLEKSHDFLNKIVNILLISLFVNLTISDLLSIFDYKSLFFTYLCDMNFIVLLVFILSILIFKSFKKCFISYLLIFIWFPLFVIMIFLIINNEYSIIDSRIMEYIVKFLFVYESIFISLVIAYKYNLIEKEKEQLIIESKNKEILYIRQSKLIKMGEMLNNIAHQWKQPLARINSIVFKSYDLIDENKKDDLKQELSFIENETFLMSNTISSLLSFFHINKKEEIFNLYELALNQKKLLKGNNLSITFEINCSDKTITTIGYKNEYEQVIRVIIENAIESINNSKISDSLLKINIYKQDDIPIFSIENSGENIDKEIIDKIFEPYFTTKNKNKHQGIGLYMSRMLIEDGMNKKLEVENTPNGVNFIIKG